MRDFIILPRISPPMYLINTKSFASYRVGLKLYGSFTLKSRIKKGMAIVFFPLLKLKKQEIHAQVKERLDIISEILTILFRRETLHFSIYFSSWSRGVVQLVLPSGEVKGFLKISFDSSGKTKILREKENLSFIKSLNFSSFSHPEIIDSGSLGISYYILLSSPKVYNSINWFLNENIMKISLEIFEREKRTSKLIDAPFLKSLNIGWFDSEKYILTLFERIIDRFANLRFPFGISHGDFKPWNMIKDRNGDYFLYDWEELSLLTPPLFDLFSFSIFTPATLKYEFSPQWMEKQFYRNIKYYKKFLEEAGMQPDDEVVEFLLLLYLFQLVSKDELWNKWEKREKRPSMIRESLKLFLKYKLKNWRKT